MYIKNTSGVAALWPRFAGMKNSLVALALIAIFVRGILAKFSHLQQDRGRPTTLFDVYKPFLSSAVFHLEDASLSPSAASSIGDTEAGMDFSPPSLAWNDFIKFALIILLGGILLAETTALLLGNGARYATLFLLSRGDLWQ